MLTADIIAMRVWLRIHSPNEIDLWAEEYIATNPDADPLAYELLSCSPSIQDDLFLDFTRLRFGFAPSSTRGVSAVEAIVMELADRALSRSLSVPDFCKAVGVIDQALIDELQPDVSYPEGLRELWNACDWCDDRWTLDNQPRLAPIIEDVCRRLRGKMG